MPHTNDPLQLEHRFLHHHHLLLLLSFLHLLLLLLLFLLLCLQVDWRSIPTHRTIRHTQKKGGGGSFCWRWGQGRGVRLLGFYRVSLSLSLHIFLPAPSISRTLSPPISFDCLHLLLPPNPPPPPPPLPGGWPYLQWFLPGRGTGKEKYQREREDREGGRIRKVKKKNFSRICFIPIPPPLPRTSSSSQSKILQSSISVLTDSFN